MEATVTQLKEWTLQNVYLFRMRWYINSKRLNNGNYVLYYCAGVAYLESYGNQYMALEVSAEDKLIFDEAHKAYLNKVKLFESVTCPTFWWYDNYNYNGIDSSRPNRQFYENDIKNGITKTIANCPKLKALKFCKQNKQNRTVNKRKISRFCINNLDYMPINMNDFKKYK